MLYPTKKIESEILIAASHLSFKRMISRKNMMK